MKMSCPLRGSQLTMVLGLSRSCPDMARIIFFHFVFSFLESSKIRSQVPSLKAGQRLCSSPIPLSCSSSKSRPRWVCPDQAVNNPAIGVHQLAPLTHAKKKRAGFFRPRFAVRLVMRVMCQGSWNACEIPIRCAPSMRRSGVAGAVHISFCALYDSSALAC